MQHTLLSIDALKPVPDFLKADYALENGKNPARIKMIELARSLTSHVESNLPKNAANILLGMYVFMFETLQNDYKNTDRLWWSCQHSKFYQSLSTRLNVPDYNKINKKITTIYLADFYEYMAANIDLIFSDEAAWKEKKELMDAIKHVSRTLLEKQASHIDALLTSRPIENRLRARLAQILPDYRADCEKKLKERSRFSIFQSDGNEPLAKFIDFINNYCVRYLDKDRKGELDLNPAQESEQTYMLRAAVIVYVMKTIENSYSLRRPNGNSKLYDACCLALSVTSTQEIDAEVKQTWLDVLKVHLSTIAKYRKDFLVENPLSDSKDPLQDIKTHRAAIAAMVAEYAKNEAEPSVARDGVETITSGVVQAGTNEAIGKVAGGISTSKVLTDKIVDMASYAVFGKTGQVLGWVFRSAVMPMVAATIYARLLEKIGSTIARGAAGIITFPIDYSIRGMYALAEYYKEVVDIDEIRREINWIKCLMKFPDDVFEKRKKDVIQNITGFDIPVENEVKSSLAI